MKITEKTTERYIEAIGRRKTSVARVRLSPGKSGAAINGTPVGEYFRMPALQHAALSPLKDRTDSFGISVLVSGGGISSQAEAVRHGLATALSQHDPEARKPLKKQGFLKRDSRMKERRKFGLKKARKAAQWAKR